MERDAHFNTMEAQEKPTCSETMTKLVQTGNIKSSQKQGEQQSSDGTGCCLLRTPATPAV